MTLYEEASMDLEIASSLQRIHAEYREMPGLCLTKPQMQRLFGIESFVCDALVDALVSARILRQTLNGRYMAHESARA
jgi:hypothetical protein